MWRNYLALRWFFSGEQLSRFQGGHKANANGISTQVFTASGVERNRRRSNRAEVRSLEASADLSFCRSVGYKGLSLVDKFCLAELGL